GAVEGLDGRQVVDELVDQAGAERRITFEAIVPGRGEEGEDGDEQEDDGMGEQAPSPGGQLVDPGRWPPVDPQHPPSEGDPDPSPAPGAVRSGHGGHPRVEVVSGRATAAAQGGDVRMVIVATCPIPSDRTAGR